MDKEFNLTSSHHSPAAVHAEQRGHVHCYHKKGGIHVCCHCGTHVTVDGEHGQYLPSNDADIPATPDPSTQ